MANQTWSTLLCGAVAAAIGVFYALWALGLLGSTGNVSADERAVSFCIGAVFAAGGVAAMLTTLRGPRAATAIKYLGLVIITGFAAIDGWIAIGPGERHFGSPFAIFGPQVNEISGRVVFGAGALICLAIALAAVRGLGVRRRGEPG